MDNDSSPRTILGVGGMDDGVRDRYAINISIRPSQEGELLILFDDVRASSDQESTWERPSFITSFRANSERFRNAEWTDEDLSAIGRIVAGRLYGRLSIKDKP
ncbi:MAG: hypothetical protein AAGD01_15175 [Acidobacteriota bacterium]